jgi:hypothetical protein
LSSVREINGDGREQGPLRPEREGDLLGAIETLLNLRQARGDDPDSAAGRQPVGTSATSADGRVIAAEERASAAEERADAAEERASAAEERASAAEERLGAAQDRAGAARHESEHLHRAMESRASIEQAKGILMQRHGITPDRAFDLLRRISMRYNVKLHDIAEGLVREASGTSRDGEARTG